MSDAKFVGGHDVNMRRNWWERPKAVATILGFLNKRIFFEFEDGKCTQVLPSLSYIQPEYMQENKETASYCAT